jgi:hypothetical protein
VRAAVRPAAAEGDVEAQAEPLRRLGGEPQPGQEPLGQEATRLPIGLGGQRVHVGDLDAADPGRRHGLELAGQLGSSTKGPNHHHRIMTRPSGAGRRNPLAACVRLALLTASSRLLWSAGLERINSGAV